MWSRFYQYQSEIVDIKDVHRQTHWHSNTQSDAQTRIFLRQHIQSWNDWILTLQRGNRKIKQKHVPRRLFQAIYFHPFGVFASFFSMSICVFMKHGICIWNGKIRQYTTTFLHLLFDVIIFDGLFFVFCFFFINILFPLLMHVIIAFILF